MKHNLSCQINTLVHGDHAYCECECHLDNPAIPPSRERRMPDRTIFVPFQVDGVWGQVVLAIPHGGKALKRKQKILLHKQLSEAIDTYDKYVEFFSEQEATK